MPIPPTICCTTCMTAENNGGRAADFSCEVCCVRNIMQMIAFMGEFGDKGHAERIKNKLFEELARMGK